MKKLFKLVHHDFYLPLSAQATQIHLLTNAEEILKYSPEAIRKASPILDQHDLSPANIKLSLMLNSSLVFPKDFNPLTIKELSNHPDFYEAFKQYALSRPENLTDGQKAVLINKFNLDWTDKLQFSELDSFEEIWNVLYWKSVENFSDQENKWIIEQTFKLIDSDKIDLHYLSLVYDVLCGKLEVFNYLWETYDRLVSSYFYAFAPDDILRILNGYLNKNHKSVSEWNWIYNLSQLNLSYFEDFSSSQLCKFVQLAEQMNMKLRIEVINKAKEESKVMNHENLYIWVKYKYNKLTKPHLENLLARLTPASKIDLISTFLALKIEDSLFLILINSLASHISEISASELLKLCWLFFSAKKFKSESLNLLLSLESRIQTLPFIDIVSIMNYISKLKEPVTLPPAYLENLKNKVLGSFNKINNTNFNIIAKFFSSLYPDQLIHDKLCQLLIENDSPDYKSSKRPNHQFFVVSSPKEYLILNNTLLNNIDFIRVLVVITSLNSTYPVPIELKKVQKKYLKVLISKCYFKLDLKFRASIAEMLAKPNLFDRELFLMFVENVKLNLIYSNKPKTFMPFLQAIKELKARGHSDKVLSQLLEIYP